MKTGKVFITQDKLFGEITIDTKEELRSDEEELTSEFG